ncbi:MAG: GatB/YqeY domain-containing protein [Rhodospirillales bacterium]|nr:GatB/YqeY domain-containing protein [Rhodospirillales bacterium]
MLRTRLKESLIVAMKAKDERSVSTLRLILAGVKDRDIAARSKGNKDGVSDEELLGLFQSMIKQRHESIRLYKQGGRQDLVDRETQEIAVIETFLPQQMNADEVADAVGKLIAEIEAKSLKDMGRTMAALKERHAGRMDMAKASALVKQKLSG